MVRKNNMVDMETRALILTVCGLVMGVSVVFGFTVATPMIVFFHEPIPCKIYLEKKKYFD